MAHRITLRSLRALDACTLGLEDFARACPRGLTVSGTPTGRARQAERLGPILGAHGGWYAGEVLPEDAQDAYAAVVESAWDTFDATWQSDVVAARRTREIASFRALLDALAGLD